MIGSPRPLRLSALVASIPGAARSGDADPEVRDVAYRTEDVTPGSLFFAVPGTRTDGHAFVSDAVARGAVAALVQSVVPGVGIPQVVVPSVRAAMGPVAAELFGHPSRGLTLAGVTGTNGKTTVTYLMESVFRAAGWTAGVIGTTGVRIDGTPVPLDRTTPEAPDLHRLLRRMAGAGVRAVAMEVSSHGLEQHRVGGARFDVAIFTNLTQDHLDYHGSLEAYLEAKARLFTPELADRAAVNLDDGAGRTLVRADLDTVTFGIEAEADIRATGVRVGADGVAFRVDGLDVTSPLRGRFSVYNCLAAMAGARQLGIADDAIVEGLAALEGVPGRIEPVQAGQDFLVLVDYAHTPDSVRNVLEAARPLTSGRVIALIGCGGDRDRAKRPLMGEAATRAADLTVVTSDNPRSEDPLAIIAEIEPGAKRGGGAYVIEPDRRAAIRRALAAAEPGDVVIIAGKGHESGQEFADRTIPFDDRAVARAELEALAGERSAR